MNDLIINVWLIIGLTLLILENLIPGVYVMWFAFGALVTSLFTDILTEISQQIFLFVVISFVSLYTYVKFTENKKPEEKKEVEIETNDYLINQYGETISNRRVKVGDTEWIIANQSYSFNKGEKVIVKKVLGSSLFIERIVE
jgi:hypothetical protein cbatJ_00495